MAFGTRYIIKMRSTVGLVIQVSGSLVEVDVMELLRIPCPGAGIYHASMELGRQMVKELDLKLTLRFAIGG